VCRRTGETCPVASQVTVNTGVLTKFTLPKDDRKFFIFSMVSAQTFSKTKKLFFAFFFFFFFACFKSTIVLVTKLSPASTAARQERKRATTCTGNTNHMFYTLFDGLQTKKVLHCFGNKINQTTTIDLSCCSADEIPTCSFISDCASCAKQSHCGWCFNTGKCSDTS
jgi:hypothetical protein